MVYILECTEDQIIRIPRESRNPESNNIVYFLSTNTNYNIFEDVHLDVNTNLNILLDVLSNCNEDSVELYQHGFCLWQ